MNRCFVNSIAQDTATVGKDALLCTYNPADFIFIEKKRTKKNDYPKAEHAHTHI